MVARRMRETLIEVLGEERGGSLYTMDWLRERVRFHLDPGRCTGEVFVAELASGHLAGHAIVRVECEDEGYDFGLFSTMFVERASRRMGVADRLLVCGEQWMLAKQLREGVTYTSASNAKLIALFGKHGYTVVAAESDMVKLARRLPVSCGG